MFQLRPQKRLVQLNASLCFSKITYFINNQLMQLSTSLSLSSACFFLFCRVYFGFFLLFLSPGFEPEPVHGFSHTYI